MMLETCFEFIREAPTVHRCLHALHCSANCFGNPNTGSARCPLTQEPKVYGLHEYVNLIASRFS